MRDFGTIVSFELDGGFEEGERFAESLQLFSIAASVGSTESLVMPPQLLRGGSTPRRSAQPRWWAKARCACRSASRTSGDLKADLAKASGQWHSA